MNKGNNCLTCGYFAATSELFAPNHCRVQSNQIPDPAIHGCKAWIRRADGLNPAEMARELCSSCKNDAWCSKKDPPAGYSCFQNREVKPMPDTTRVKVKKNTFARLF